MRRRKREAVVVTSHKSLHPRQCGLCEARSGSDGPPVQRRTILLFPLLLDDGVAAVVACGVVPADLAPDCDVLLQAPIDCASLLRRAFIFFMNVILPSVGCDKDSQLQRNQLVDSQSLSPPLCLSLHPARYGSSRSSASLFTEDSSLSSVAVPSCYL